MKPFNLLLMFLLLLACNDHNAPNEFMPSFDDINLSSSSFSSTEVHSRLQVTMADIVNYIAKVYPDEQILQVQPLCTDGKVKAYCVKCSSMWIVIAADKRCSPLLAVSHTGDINLNDVQSPLTNLIFGMIEQSSASCSNSDNNTKCPEWSVIDSNYKVHPQQSSSESQPTHHRDGYGMWVITGTSSFEDTTLQNHLITTLWTQGNPYNAYTPYYAYQIYEHCPVGCVPLAVGQVIYKYRENMSNNTSIPSSAHMPSANYQPFIVDSYSSTIWPQLRNNSSYAALFLAQIGVDLHSTYSSSSTITSHNYVDSCMNKYNVTSSSYYGFSYDLVKNNVMSGQPVIVSIGPDNLNAGHTFIIDACRIVNSYYRVHYEWDPDYLPTQMEYAQLPVWRFDPVIDGKDELTEFDDDVLVNTSVAIGTNMCLEYYSQVWFPLYYINYPYEYHDETGSYYVPGSQHYYTLQWNNYSTTRKIYYSISNIN